MTSHGQLVFLAASIFAGILFPSLAALCQPLLFPTIFLLFVFAIFQVRFVVVFETLTRDRSTWLVLVWQLVLLPVLAAVLLKPVLQGQWYVFTVVTMCTSAITATTALSRIFNLNDAMALAVCIAGTVVMPLPLYLTLNSIVGLETSISLAVYSERILLFILLPFLVVWLLRVCLPSRLQTELVSHTPSIVLVLLMLFGLCVMDGVREMLENDPWMLARLVLLAFAISFLVQIITYFGLYRLGIANAKTSCLLCAYRNMGLVAAIAGSSLGEHFLIFVGVWQLPMYVLPLVLARFYRAV